MSVKKPQPAQKADPHAGPSQQKHDAGTASPSDAGAGNKQVSQAQSPLKPQLQADALEPMQIPGLETIHDQLNGLAAGDLDGDGSPELAVITQNRLSVYRATQERWEMLAEFKSKAGGFIGVDAADLNGNGRKEIFITAFDSTDGAAASFVMEYTGGKLQHLSRLMPWYFRMVDIDNRGQVLVGQRQVQGERFVPGIYEMEWRSAGYQAGTRLSLPDNVNIFGFARGPVRSAGQMEVVRYGSSGHVQILDLSGNEGVVSADRFGGGVNAIVFTDEEQWDEKEHVFLPPRILLKDIDADGVQEMLVVNNDGGFAGRGVLERHRNYKKGRLQWLQHSNGVLRTAAGTLDMPRFIVDAALVDINGDRQLEIIAAVVNKPRGPVSKGASSLVAYEMMSAK
jgi:hypothetical protein